MLLLSKNDIEKVFTMQDAIEADKEAFKIFSQGRSEVPLLTTIQTEDGVFLFMPAYAKDAGYASLKNVNIFAENAKNNLPTAPAQVLLIDGKTGIVEAIIDGTYVTQIRTGAASGAAFDVLGREDAKTGALIGTGSQAAQQLEAMLAVRNLEQVKVFSRNREARELFVDEMQKKMKSYAAKIVAAESADAAIEDADLIIAVTPSKTPVFDGKKVKAGATVSFMGAYQPDMQEMAPALLTRAAKVYFDSEAAVLHEAGDILIPLKEGLVREEDFTGDLGNLLLGKLPGRESNEEIIIFKSVGIGVQDLVAAKAIYEKARKQGVGVNWE